MLDDADAERYRHAANAALQEIDWCISYLRDIRKTSIARTLARNRDRIRRTLVEAEQPRAAELSAKPD